MQVRTVKKLMVKTERNNPLMQSMRWNGAVILGMRRRCRTCMKGEQIELHDFEPI